MQHVLILHCMYVPMSVTLGPWGVPSDVMRKCRARDAWLHGLGDCRMVIIIICARAHTAWLHLLLLLYEQR